MRIEWAVRGQETRWREEGNLKEKGSKGRRVGMHMLFHLAVLLSRTKEVRGALMQESVVGSLTPRFLHLRRLLAYNVESGKMDKRIQCCCTY